MEPTSHSPNIEPVSTDVLQYVLGYELSEEEAHGFYIRYEVKRDYTTEQTIDAILLRATEYPAIQVIRPKEYDDRLMGWQAVLWWSGKTIVLWQAEDGTLNY